jgi:hypothetical protein
MTERFFSAKAELDLLVLERTPPTPAADDGGDGSATTPSNGGAAAAARGTGSMELLRTYLGRIADLENEVKSLRSLQQLTAQGSRRRGDASGGANPAANPAVRTSLFLCE